MTTATEAAEAPAAESPDPHSPAADLPAGGAPAQESPAAESQPPETESAGGAEGDSETADPGAAEKAPKGEDFAAPPEDLGDQSLPLSVVRAYYGAGQSRMGAGAFGPGAVAAENIYFTQPTHTSDGYATYQLPDRVVREQIETYASTSTDEELAERLAVQSVVYLSGEAGSGMPTTATVALATRHRSQPEHPPDGDREHHRVAHVELVKQSLFEAVGEPKFLLERCGHVLDLDAEAKLERAHLEVLEARAQRIGATVVVVSRTDARDHDLSRYLVRHQPPDPAEVFRAWLSYQLRRAGRCAGICSDCDQSCHAAYVARCLGDPALVGQLQGTCEVTDVVRLAQHCASDIPDLREPLRIPEDAAGRRRQASRLLNVDWESAGGKRTAHHLQAFRIAYALLDGVSITHVFDAVGRLVNCIDRAERRRQTGRAVLELDVGALLGSGVRPETDEVGSLAATGTARPARLRDPQLARFILDVAWNDYDSLREPLLWWVCELGGHAHPTVRMRIAAATGWLCGHDLEGVQDRVIDVWATDRRRDARQTAALALESAAHNEHLRSRVLRYVRALARDQSPYRRDVAARIYATPLGRAYWHYAITDLWLVARDPIQERNDVVARALASVYDSAAEDVLATLRRWVAADGPVSNHADRCFALLARRMDDSWDGWPRLLADASRDGGVPASAGPREAFTSEAIQQHLAQLWRSALLRPLTAAGAWEALEYWVNAADRRPVAADVLAKLLALVLVDPPLRRRGRFYAHRWRDRMPGNPFVDRVDALLHSQRG